MGCFKIEGRLKGPEYVALTTSVYRRAVDEAWAQREQRLHTAGSGDTAGDAAGSHGVAGVHDTAGESIGTKEIRVVGGKKEASSSVGEWKLTDKDRMDLTQVFARGQDGEHDGLTRGFLEGPRHQRLVRGRGPRHRGVLLGEVGRRL